MAAEPLKTQSVISQAELAMFCELREQHNSLRRHLKESLELGATIEFGIHSAKLIENEVKRPNWKGFILRKHGKKTVSRIAAATPATHYFRMEVR